MSYLAIKRLFDICCAGAGLLVLLPLGLLIGLLIKLSDGGPIFFRQIRIGQFGKPFRIQKFRSMVVDADQIGVTITKDRDPRITTIGRILRKTKLDELPQLWNVLTGEMSFVGPRPEVPKYVEHYTPEQRGILQLKPGITDLATLLFRNEEVLLSGAKNVEEFYLQYCLPKKIELNQYYAQRANLPRDIWLILQTLCPYWVGVMGLYGVLLAASFWFSYQLRSDFQMTSLDYKEFRICLPWIVFSQLILLVWRGQLSGLLSYFSVSEARLIATSLTGALLLQVGFCYLFLGSIMPPRSLFLIDLIISFFALCGCRMFFRLLREHASEEKPNYQAQVSRVAIIGTGSLAMNLALDFARSTRPARRVVAFFDDNPHTWQKRPYDIPVFGMPECLLNPEWLNKIDEVIVALPEENHPRQEQVSELLRGLPLKVTVASGWPVVKTLEY